MPRSSSPAPAPPSTDEGWGPEASGGRRRGRRRRVATVVVVLVAALVGAVAMPVAAGLGGLDRVAVPALAGSPGPTHVLVVGSDAREQMTPEQQAELGTGFTDGVRTDTLFVLTVEGDRAAILGLPRDLWVTRCDGSNGRINTAYALGGPDCLVRTVQGLTGIGIDHYVEVDFLGFVDIVGAVGGVELCLDKAIKDPFAAIDLPAGCQNLQGRDALGYVRVRKIDNDLMRIQRQQQFVAALAGKVLEPSILLNPFRATAVAGAVGRSLTVDDGLGPTGALALARGGRGLANGAFVAATVPVTDATIGGASVLLPIDGDAAALFNSFIDGSVLDGAAPPAEGTDDEAPAG